MVLRQNVFFFLSVFYRLAPDGDMIRCVWEQGVRLPPLRCCSDGKTEGVAAGVRWPTFGRCGDIDKNDDVNFSSSRAKNPNSSNPNHIHLLLFSPPLVSPSTLEMMRKLPVTPPPATPHERTPWEAAARCEARTLIDGGMPTEETVAYPGPSDGDELHEWLFFVLPYFDVMCVFYFFGMFARGATVANRA